MNELTINRNQVFVDRLEVDDQKLVVGPGVTLRYIVPVISSITAPKKREIVLAGDRATAEVFGVFLGSGDDLLNLSLDTTHQSPNTIGRTEFRAVLGGRSNLEFNGMIKIMAGAQNSNDFLQQDSLMLSENARANAVPGLEIEANEVKASHGATAKPVDPEQKFYLMSRGLSAEVAEAMVVTGFLYPILKQIADPALKATIEEALQKKFLNHHT